MTCICFFPAQSCQSRWQDEVIAALALSDGVILLVDVVVGLTQHLDLDDSSLS